MPALVGGLQHERRAGPRATPASIESARPTKHAASGLLDGGVNVDQVDQDDGEQVVAKIFGGNDSQPRWPRRWPAAARGGGDLLKKLLPILAPIVLAYIGKQLGQKRAPAGGSEAQASGGGGLDDVLGSILGGHGGGGGNNPLGSILGSVLGGARAAADRRDPRRTARRKK